MDNADWRQECAKLHIELDKVRAECAEWKEKWERLMQFKEAPRLPLRGRVDKLTTVGWDSQEDWK